MNNIFKYLDELIPNPKCELNYNKDYELLIAVMLSAQTTDKRVNEVTKVLFSKYNTLESLKNANIEDIKSIIRPLGSYNKKASNIIEISKRINGSLNNRELLESLPGVGRKTANVVLGELYNIPCIAVDTHVERVSKRLGLVDKNSNVLEIEETLNKLIPDSKKVKLHKQLVLFGRYYCKAVKPLCTNCKLKNICRRDII